ncbi:MAG: hypothetical protein JHD00_13555 [Akkermansiaceae bacterium]|nr:hypothetical protein [Akkermansiaceae bacterium]
MLLRQPTKTLGTPRLFPKAAPTNGFSHKISAENHMKAITVGIFAAFAYSYGLWAIARMNGLNLDPVEAGVVKSTAYTFLIALPIGVAAHAVVSFFRWRILLMIPSAFAIAFIAATLLCAFNSPEGQLMNILAFLGMPVAFSIPYALVLNRRAEQAVTPNGP